MGFQEHLTQTITIATETGTNDGMGAWSIATAETTIKGLIRQLSASEQYFSDRTQSQSTHRLYCVPTTSITPAVKIQDPSGNTYKPARANDVMVLGRVMQVDLTRVD